MRPLWKKILLGAGAAVALVVVGGGGYAWSQARAFDASVSKIHELAIPEVTRSSDATVLARGEHLVRATGGCAAGDCHGEDLSGGRTIKMGPVATLTGPNITPSGLGAVYSDGELFRLLRHGVRKGGQSVRFMPVHETNWLPDDDLLAIVSYMRTVAAVERANGPVEIGLIGKVLDRHDQLHLDIARRIDHDNIELAGAPEPSAKYGAFLARACMGCHGGTFSGGPIPGAPKEMPTPTNLTPHQTGIAGWTFEDFDRLLTKGEKKNGEKLDPFMPIDALGKLDAVEKRALFAFLSELPPRPFGGR